MNTTNNTRVALVQPRIPDGNYLPNLGIMYLAALLRRQQFDVRVFDENIENAIVPRIIAFAPRIMGITCVTAALNPSVRLAEAVKRALPTLSVVVGGPHPSVLPRDTLLNNPVIDCVFIGEAERSFLQYCRIMCDPHSGPHCLADVPGIAYRTGDSVQSNRAAPYLSNDELDQLPFPAWDLLPLEQVFRQATHGLFTRGRRIMPIMTTRGCPNYCTFCSRVMGFNFRKRSVPNVLQEVSWLHQKYNIDEIYFEDDTFTQDPARAHELLDGIITLNLGIHVKFANGLRADKVDEALLEKMRAAGVYWIGFGIESGSPRTQKLMVKNLDLDLAASNVRLAKRMGFRVGSNCIIGYPGETPLDIKQSIDYFLRLPLDSFAVVPCIPFPGTTAWVECSKNGWLTNRANNYDNYWFQIFKVNPLIETPYLSSQAMAQAIRRVYLRFYLLNARRGMTVANMMVRKCFRRVKGLKWMRMLRANSASVAPREAPEYAC